MKKNNGISHFGIHPEYFNPESVRFDVFHLRCAITRRLMVHVRKFMLKASPGLYSEFSTVLESFWTDYNVLLWNMNKPFQKLKGNELLLFIRNTKKIVDWLKSKFVLSEHLNNLCRALILWSKITPFMVKTTIDDIEVYKNELKEWEEWYAT